MKIFNILKLALPALTRHALHRLRREVELASFTPAPLAKAFREEL